MADDLSFTISAEDQASRTVDTVQKKIQGFGSDIAKMALGVVGPMALVTAGIGLVMDKWNKYQEDKKASREAFYRQQEESDKLAHDKENVEIQKTLEAYKKAEEEKTAKLKLEEERRLKKLNLREEIQALQEENARGGKPLEGVDLLNKLGNDVRDAYDKKRSYDITNRASDDVRLAAQYDYEKKLNAFLKEKNKQDEESKKDIEKGKDNSKPEETKAVKDTIKVTVSSLREIGGSFGNGDINTGIETQIELARKGNDLLTTIATNTSYLKTDNTGNPIMVGDTNFTIPDGKGGFRTVAPDLFLSGNY
jgi:hypothetical protein